MFIAIDTSMGTMVELVDAGGTSLVRFCDDEPRGHLECISHGVEKCIEEIGLRAGSLEAILCAVGPGPFAALRVGVAAARTLAFARAVPFVPVGSHFAAAQGYICQISHRADTQAMMQREPDTQIKKLVVANRVGRGAFATSVYTLSFGPGGPNWHPDVGCEAFARLGESDLKSYAQSLGAELCVPTEVSGVHLLGAYKRARVAVQSGCAHCSTPNKILYLKI